MPKLRVLNLRMSLGKGVDWRVLHLWPEGYEAQFPWPELEDLTVPFPSPEDQIYSHLPISMRRLSLRCSPHYCFHLWEAERLYHLRFPILYASEMLEIFAKINAPYLDYLQLEYRADAAEDDLLKCLVQKFPRLTFLVIHRFQSVRASNVTVDDIALRLSEFRHLITLRAHLDFCANDKVMKTLRETAAILVDKLALQDMVNGDGKWRLTQRGTRRSLHSSFDLRIQRPRTVALHAPLFK
ncbi:hypothetical protein DAEQUDRAFT_370915 [Daedalea quercina L-15889]|uniref:F-box domain-containing protein n=1 Tax=Daedalea quercina L-15889 TaxID=1314783 RepID=A0A165PBD8_9APHY|nr:hypothetical protein DAEQUDRAFT_370915 [Daedalea quercina L-15889]